MDSSTSPTPTIGIGWIEPLALVPGHWFPSRLLVWKATVSAGTGFLRPVGQYIADAVGGTGYWPASGNASYDNSAEAAKSDCLVRCCKALPHVSGNVGTMSSRRHGKPNMRTKW